MSAEAVDLFGAHSPAFGGVGSTLVFRSMMEGPETVEAEHRNLSPARALSM